MLFFSRRWLCPGAISWTLWWKCWISGKDIWCNSCPFKLSSLYSFWWFICECKFDHSSQLSQWNLPLWHRRGTKKKIWVPDRNRTHDLPNTGQVLYPLSYMRLWDNEKIWVPDGNQTHDLLNTGCALSTELRELMKSKVIFPSLHEFM